MVLDFWLIAVAVAVAESSPWARQDRGKRKPHSNIPQNAEVINAVAVGIW